MSVDPTGMAAMNLSPATPPFPLLCLDPSSTKIGWALFIANQTGPVCVQSNFFQIPETAPPDARVIMVGPAVIQIMQLCETNGYRPAAVLIEIPDFIAHYAKDHIVTYHRAVGVAEYAVYQTGLPIFRVTASQDKRKGRKDRYKQRFRNATGRHAGSDDESDAFCICQDYLGDLIAAAKHQRGQLPF
jgi:Holliday junction resolvasome RuvABC endonuclease subunit